MPDSEQQQEPDAPPGTGVLAVIQSVAAAAIGVQSQANKERDFSQGKAWHFVVGGLIGTLVFMFVIYLFVRVMLATN